MSPAEAGSTPDHQQNQGPNTTADPEQTGKEKNQSCNSGSSGQPLTSLTRTVVLVKVQNHGSDWLPVSQVLGFVSLRPEPEPCLGCGVLLVLVVTNMEVLLRLRAAEPNPDAGSGPVCFIFLLLFLVSLLLLFIAARRPGPPPPLPHSAETRRMKRRMKRSCVSAPWISHSSISSALVPPRTRFSLCCFH